MRVNNMAILMETDRLPKNKNAYVEVWAMAAKLLMPGLGKLYSRFYPSMSPWGHRITTPFGVIFGKQHPEQFLTLYHAAQEAQSNAVGFHLAGLLKDIDPNTIYSNDGTVICPITVSAKNEEQLAHAVWHMSIVKGAPLPDCGIYYAAWNGAIATTAQERMILENPAGYALCLVALEPMEGSNEL